MPSDSGDAKHSALVGFAARYWLAILLAVLAAVFIGQNRSPVSVDFLWVTVTSPLWLLLTAIIVVGVVIGLLLRRRRRQ